MNIKISAITLAFVLVFSIFVFPQRSQTNRKIAKIPFTFKAKDFGEVRIRTEKKVNSKDQAVIDKWPIDAPEHTCYDLEVKRPLPALDKGARYFYPAYSYVCIVPTSDATEQDFALGYPNFSDAVDKLRGLLQKRPQTFRQFADLFDFPYNNAGWSFKSKVQYLDFPNVSGILFLTQYNQGYLPSPANNEELTANFQGLTRDGSFYIAARFATTHPSLPRGIDFVDKSIQDPDYYMSNEEMRKYEGEYLRKEGEKVDRLSESKFRPSFRTIKRLIASISVE